MITSLKYHIGEYYRYPNSGNLFKLIEKRDFVFLFECGHWCTDTVFKYLTRVKTNVSVFEDIQYELEF